MYTVVPRRAADGRSIVQPRYDADCNRQSSSASGDDARVIEQVTNYRRQSVQPLIQEQSAGQRHP